MQHKLMDAITSTKGWFITNSFGAITTFWSLFYPENISQTNDYLEVILKIVSMFCAMLGGAVSAIKLYRYLKAIKW